ncbi:hypothetical protein [Aquabacterium sp.]
MPLGSHAHMRRWPCHAFQGCLFSKPVPHDAFEELPGLRSAATTA